MMRVMTKYICEFCGTEYADKNTAAECEKNHKTVSRIKNMTYKPIRMLPNGYPIKIEVEMEDGKVIEFKR